MCCTYTEALENLLDEALRAEAEGDMVKARAKLGQSAELQSTAETPLHK